MTHQVGNPDEPQLEEIATFLQAADAGSLTRAGRRLGVPKSTVSRRISRLEEKLGVALLLRSTRRFALTELGAVYRERVESAMADITGAAEAIRDQRATPRGHLRLTAPFDLGNVNLGGLIAEFTRQNPACTVEVRFADEVVDLVAEGIDVALRILPRPPDSTLVARRITSVELGLYVSPEYLRARGAVSSVDEIAAHPFLLRRSTPHGRSVLRLRGPAEEEREITVRAVLGCNDFALVVAAALAHAGIAVLPSVYARDELRAGRLCRVLPEWNTGVTSLFVIHQGAKKSSAAVRAFCDLAIAWLGPLDERPERPPQPTREKPPRR